MALFGYKNDSKEFKELEVIKNEIESLLKLDKYISKKEYLNFINSNKEIYDKLLLMKNENVLDNWCKNNKTDFKKILKYMEYYENISKVIDNHNEQYVNNHLLTDKLYLDNVLYKDDPNITLDEEQRRVVLSDEDYTLVIAGAGAGKTTTIEAKVKYLVDKNNISPEKILVISFTKKATAELKDRFKKLEIPVDIATFHSVGYKIIKQEEVEKHQIAGMGFMYDSIKNFLSTKLDDKYFIRKILLFFASYLNMPFDDENTSDLYKVLLENSHITMKEELTKILDSYKASQTKNKVTINEERVRSVDECRIANFLYINGIDYEYEPIYKYGFKDTLKPYCPDFLIKQGDKEIYLEHFGISESGKNSRFTAEELETYKKHVNEKILLHKEHGTKLIYTFSKYNDKRDLITHLEELLIKENIELHKVDEEDIYRRLANNAEDQYFYKFNQLICVFISKFKVNNFTLSKFDEWKTSIKDERTKLFVEICYLCYLAYSTELKDKNCIDFEDMINDASNILEEKIQSGEKLPYDYIFVDEYQDISLQRFNLCEKLSKASDAKIVAVGDDWQSIYRFSGSKIDLFTKFEDIMGYANILKITKTYRNSQELIDIAGGFVMENNEQIKKRLKSNKSIDDPILLMSYDDTPKTNPNEKGPYYNLGLAIEKSLEHIVDKCGMNKSVLLIGRYNFDGSRLSQLDDLFEVNNNKIKSKKYPELAISYLTAHSSKGLGADNVIIINGKDDILGFPSKIEDDKVMKLVIKDEEKIDFAEERRLFYVALTRTKNRVYIVTPQNHPSKFILEIKDKFTNVILKGNKLNPQGGIDFKIKCPYCSYPLQKRKNKNITFAKQLWICSNDPEICGYMTNDLKGGILSICKCPDCYDGYLVVKPIKDESGNDTGDRILGCTNFKKDGTGCKGYMSKKSFTYEKPNAFGVSKEIRKFDIVDGMNIVDFICHIKNIISDIKTQYTNFNISISTISNILCGENSKVVVSFKLYNLSSFGCIKSDRVKRVWRLLKTLEEKEMFIINDGSVIALKDNITEEDYITIISEVK